MLSLDVAKVLGVVGTVTNIVAPFIDPLLWLLGFVLLLTAVYGVSKAVGVPEIFRDYVVAFVTVVAGILVASLAGFSFKVTITHGEPGLIRLLVSAILVIAILWAFLVASAIFIRRSYRRMARSLNHRFFSVVGTVYLAGAVLTIAAIGFLILFVGMVIELVAWATLPTSRPSYGFA